MDKQPGHSRWSVGYPNQNSATEINWQLKKFIDKLKYTDKNHEILRPKFVQMLSEKEQVTMVYKTLKEFDMLPFKRTDEPKIRKSATVSTELRNSGNAAYIKKHDNLKAISLYTGSIAAAPYPASDSGASEELALAFGNRSAVYFQLGKYEACLRDIGQALKFKYPQRLEAKLYARQAQCYQKLGRLEDARASSQDDLRHHDSATKLKKDELMATINTKQDLQGSSCAQDGGAAGKTLPRKSYGQHKNISSASSCVDIIYDPDMGRHFVANRDIDPGDVLLVEESFASILLPESALTHCNKCLKRFDALIPCKTCDIAMYCSNECRSASWQKSHSVECRLSPALIKLNVGKKSSLDLPLRMLLNACSQNQGIHGLYHLVKTIEEPNTDGDVQIKGFDQNGQYNSFDYLTVHNLSHNNRKERHFLVIDMSLGAACILNCLEDYSNFFSCASLSSVSKETMVAIKMFTGGLLLKFCGIILTNAFPVTEYVIDSIRKKPDVVMFGKAVYPTSSLLNNSCDGNAVNSYHEGDIQVYMAVHSIKKGKGIYLIYNPAYFHEEITKRKRYFEENYFFDCKCEACVNDWPTFERLPFPYDQTYLCEACHTKLLALKLRDSYSTTHVICLTCRKVFHLDLLKKKTDTLMQRKEAISNEVLTKSIHKYMAELAGIVKTVYTFVQSPSQLAIHSQNLLQLSMQSSGNINVVHE